MFKWFIIHQWKSAKRSSIWQKNLAINILVGFLMFIMLLYLIMIGIMLDRVLLEVIKDKDPENVLSGALIYYIIISFVLRFFLQSIPAIQAVPYLHLPIKRSAIGHFLVLKSFTSFFNYLPIFLFLPFALKWLPAFHGWLPALTWFFSILFFEWASNLKLIWFKRKNTDKPQISLLLIAAVLGLFALDHFDVFSLSSISEWYFMGLMENIWWILLPVIALVFWYLYNIKFIKDVIYTEDLAPASSQSEQLSGNLSRLKNYGAMGELILKEVRLLLRNKRSKTVLFMIPFFLLYGLFFYPQEVYMQKTGMLVFVGIFVTGGFLIAYGQYIMAWESSHFDFILTSNTSMYDFFKAKYLLMAIPTVLLYFFTIPYIYFGVEIFWLNLAALFYNVGINAPLLLYTASFNKKRMDLSKGAMMNYQGVGVNNFLMVLPLLVMPILIFWPIKLFFGYITGVIALGTIGIIGILLHKWLIKLAVKHFEEKRYEIASGYRQRY